MAAFIYRARLVENGDSFFSTDLLIYFLAEVVSLRLIKDESDKSMIYNDKGNNIKKVNTN